MWHFFFTILVFLNWHYGGAQIPTYDIHLGNLLHMQQGIGWPLHLNVAEGHEALMRLTETLENQQSCEVTTPDGVKFDVRNPPSHRYEAWSDGCGVRVRNVDQSDVGRWRMTATRGNHSITGWTEMHVEEQITSYTPDAISLQDGHTHTFVNLSSLNNSYCLVAQPFTESSLVPGHCEVTLDRTTRAVQGRWSILLGIPGRVAELHVDTTVAVEGERLDVGYVRETENNKLHLYCNILHTAKNITFCRFQKTTEVSGFNVMDGLSDGRHSYYGQGFYNRQCGMTIEVVTAQDYGTWRCTVGVQEWVDNHIHQLTPMQALITVTAEGGTRIRRDIQRSEEEKLRTVFAREDSHLTIMCRADASLAYCWYQHPNGSQFTPMELRTEGQAYWYAGENLQSGDCGISFANVSKEDAGMWTCHMGFKYQLGVEIMDQVDVRVTGPLAANKQEVDAWVGDSATLYCHTSNGPSPLDYCRFLAPNRVGMSIDSSVNVQNAIMGRFYFTPERSLDYGDCSLTINPVYDEDFGEWTCAALLHDEIVESRDTVLLYPNSARMPRLRAGLIGTSAGILVLALVLAGAIWYKKGKPTPWSALYKRFSNRSGTTSTSLGVGSAMAMEELPRMERRASDSNSTSTSDSTTVLAVNELQPART